MDAGAGGVKPPAHWPAAAAIIAGVLALDQWSKRWIKDDLLEFPRAIEITSFFNIVWVWNEGVSFGLFGGGGTPAWVLSAVALGIVAGLAVWLWRTPIRSTAVGLSLVIGGAVGNVIDRAVWGAVFDFLDFHVMNTHWPAFNVADASITCGVVVLLLDGVVFNRPAREKA
ncbi:MAG: signal peptidase II [Pseudomonadota bacterium]